MARASDRLLTELRRSHEVYSYVDITGPNQETFRLPATDGTVTVDKSAAVRRTSTVNCVDPDGTLVPGGDGEGVLTPYGTEFRPYRGVRYPATEEFPDGEIEVVSLGVFRLAKVSIKDEGSPQITLEGFDRSRTVGRDKFVVPHLIASGTNALVAIKDILSRTFDELQYDAVSTTITTTAPRVYDVGNDPWEAVTELATSMGCEIFFDAYGVVVIAPPVNIDALPTPDFTYIEGQGCTMTDLSRVFTDEPGFNGVVVTGESPGDELPPVRGEAWDDMPNSKTYRLGPYGEVPMFVTDQLVKTVEEAEAAAEAMLNSVLGFSSQLSITATVNPTYEAGDVVEVQRAKSKISGLYAVDAFNVPLAKEGTQGLTLRQKRGG